jgi:hypothetical protein
MNPEELQTDDAWRSLFRNQYIRLWSARPLSRIASLASTEPQRLESKNILVPCATGTGQDWAGNRIGSIRELPTHHNSLCPELNFRKQPKAGRM